VIGQRLDEVRLHAGGQRARQRQWQAVRLLRKVFRHAVARDHRRGRVRRQASQLPEQQRRIEADAQRHPGGDPLQLHLGPGHHAEHVPLEGACHSGTRSRTEASRAAYGAQAVAGQRHRLEQLAGQIPGVRRRPETQEASLQDRRHHRCVRMALAQPRQRLGHRVGGPDPEIEPRVRRRRHPRRDAANELQQKVGAPVRRRRHLQP
jgi:hypothetical protein